MTLQDELRRDEKNRIHRKTGNEFLDVSSLMYCLARRRSLAEYFESLSPDVERLLVIAPC